MCQDESDKAVPVEQIVIWYYYFRPLTVLRETAQSLFVVPNRQSSHYKRIGKDNKGLCHISKLKGRLRKEIKESERRVRQNVMRVLRYENAAINQRANLCNLRSLKESLQ